MSKDKSVPQSHTPAKAGTDTVLERPPLDRSRRDFLKTAGAAGATILVAGSGLAAVREAAAAARKGGTLVHLIQPEVPTLATYLSTSSPVSQGGTRAYSGLLEYDNRARFPAALSARLVKIDDKEQFILAHAAEAGIDEAITLTQGDIRQLQLAKGAICSGVMTLQQEMGVSKEDLEELMLCGGFGNYINIASALRIRLLPAFAQDKITYYGNAAALGAQMALLSETERARAAKLAREIEHISLAAQPDFQETFMVALTFPDKSADDRAVATEAAVAPGS